MVSDATNIAEFVQEIFGDLANDANARRVDQLAGKAILTPLCDDVNAVNAIVTNLWPGRWYCTLLTNLSSNCNLQHAYLYQTFL